MSWGAVQLLYRPHCVCRLVGGVLLSGILAGFCFLFLNGLMSKLNSCKIQSRISKSSLSLRRSCVSGAVRKGQ